MSGTENNSHRSPSPRQSITPLTKKRSKAGAYTQPAGFHSRRSAVKPWASEAMRRTSFSQKAGYASDYNSAHSSCNRTTRVTCANLETCVWEGKRTLMCESKHCTLRAPERLSDHKPMWLTCERTISEKNSDN